MPIIYSQSRAARRKPPPIEKRLECTLEELCHGCGKKIKITRDAISDSGYVTLFSGKKCLRTETVFIDNSYIRLLGTN